jgi:hypothetical protein
MAAVPSRHRARAPRVEERPGALVATRRVALSLVAAVAIAASFAVIGGPLWLSAGIGALAGTRVAFPAAAAPVRAKSRRR